MAVQNCPVCGNRPSVTTVGDIMIINCSGVESMVDTHLSEGKFVSYSHALVAVGNDETAVVNAWNNQGVQL